MADFQGFYTITNVENNRPVGVEPITINPGDVAPVVELKNGSYTVFQISFVEKTGTYIISEWSTLTRKGPESSVIPPPEPRIAFVHDKRVYVRSKHAMDPTWIILKNVGADNYMIIKAEDLNEETGEIHGHWELPTNKIQVQVVGGHPDNDTQKPLPLPGKFVQLGKDGKIHHGHGDGEGLWKLTRFIHPIVPTV